MTAGEYAPQGNTCADCLLDLPPDIDAFADGRAPCPACGSLRRHVALETALAVGSKSSFDAIIADRDLRNQVVRLAEDWSKATAPVEYRSRVLAETEFSVRVANPEETGESWMVVIENGQHQIIDWGMGDSLDEALCNCVDAIALHFETP